MPKRILQPAYQQRSLQHCYTYNNRCRYKYSYR